MSIKLHILSLDKPKIWDEFIGTAPAYSIALDGYVAGPSRFDPRGPYANFDHHAGVDRPSTRATCEQVLIAIRQDLLKDAFCKENQPHANVFVLDCDEDVCLAVWLLQNSHLVENTMTPRVNRLVTVEGLLDASGGAYPFPSSLPFLRKLAWIFEPYRQFRMSGQLSQRNPADFRGVITDVGLRISKYIAGEDSADDVREIDTAYTRIGGNKIWAMVNEVGTHARTGLYGDGIKAFVSVKEQHQGKWSYTIGRVSLYIRFDIPELLRVLNEAEGSHDSADRWGGSNIIGGSPYGGSKLSPLEVETLINKYLHL